MLQRKKNFFLMVFFLIFAIPYLSYAFTEKEQLGKHLFKDKRLSLYKNQSCQSCHHPSAGFADPENKKDPLAHPVSKGSDGISFGGRNAPSAAYAGFSPVFYEAEPDVYVGGMFWDGRATGHTLMDPLAEQAQGPFLNPLEMAMADKASVVEEIAKSSYAELFLKVFPNTDFNNPSPENISFIYDNMAIAIAAFERSGSLNRFNSKFDTFWNKCAQEKIDVSEIGNTIPPESVPENILSKSQLNGLVIFNTKGKCNLCHFITPHVDSSGTAHPPVFTDFTYDNLGIPVNPKIAELKKGAQPIDYGLGARQDIASKDPVSVDNGLGQMVIVSQNQAGKFKVPTLRNIAKNPPYGHNGYFISLYDIVHFYNTRDSVEVNWPPPEVMLNMNRVELGNLRLTYYEELDLVNFMHSLNDRKIK